MCSSDSEGVRLGVEAPLSAAWTLIEERGLERLELAPPEIQSNADAGFSDVFSGGFEAEVVTEAALVLHLAEEVKVLCNCLL
jgi:hypothetical protein